MTSTAAALESTDAAPNGVAAAAEPTLLREWSYPSSPDPPVAPAVVLKEEESSPTKLQQISQSYSYPVATFVSNLVRSSVGHIIPPDLENIDEEGSSNLHREAEEATPITSIRTDPGVAAHADTHTLRSVVSEANCRGDDMFDEAEFVIVDGDLVAVPAPPPNDEEMEAFEEAMMERKNCKNRGFRRLGKWIKKRRTRRSPRNAEETIDLSYESPSAPQGPQQGKRKNKRKNKKGRRSRAPTEEDVAPQPVIPVAQSFASAYPAATAEAHLIGTTDELYEAGVLPACTSADAYVEDEDAKIDELAGTLCVEAQKVDRVESLLTNALLEQQEEELSTMLDSSLATSLESPECDSYKSCSGWPQKVPLSKASSSDDEVYNDMLKVVLVGAPFVGKTTIARALRKKSPKKSRRRSPFLGVDVHSWTPKKVENRDDEDNKQVKFSVWDINDSATAGAHPATQSLFFSESSLYVLVWDMAANNDLTLRIVPETDSEEEDDLSDDFLLERQNRQADSALEIDIQDRVLLWVDQIAATSKDCAILPVATMPEGMDPCEAQRRCSMMQALLMHHMQSFRGEHLPTLVGDTTVIRVNLNEGVEELQEAILDIATSRREQQFFEHVGIPVPKGAVEVLEAVRQLKKDNNKVVLVDHLVAAGLSASTAEINESLRFLSAIGEVLYFGTDGEDDVLSRYVVLCRKWLVSALSCILCNDLHNELAETRTFMNMQCEYSGQQFTEGDVTRTLLGGSNSNCPILSSSDASMLWQSMSFMREAADRSAQASSATSSASMFEFLKKLLVHSGVLVPLSIPSEPETKKDEVFFVPSLLPQAEPSNVWTYKTSQSWTTTLCHSWTLRDCTPPNMMERIAVSLLEDLYGFSRSSAGTRALRRSRTLSVEQSVDQASLYRCKTYPYVDREEHAVGQIKIHQVMCWRSSMVVNIGCFFEDPETGVVRESVVEVFVSLTDQHAHHCVASNSMGGGVKKLIVCGKGQSGHDGRKLWKGGYGLVLDSIKASVSYLATGNVERQVVCPECLSQSHHSDASTWNWDAVRSAVECGNPGIRCMRGHLVDANLLCGAASKTHHHPGDRQQVLAPTCVTKPVSSLLGGVVVVGLWDAQENKIRNVGSGFVADSKQGLVVTAAHILFDMSDQRRFGSFYWGLKDAKAVIGVIPNGEDTAVFRYFAEILTHDVQNMDACVLRITTKFEKDVVGEGEGCADQPEIPMLNDSEAFKSEHLKQLKMTRRCELEEKVRILGFNQGGEGILEQGKHVNRCVDFAKGYVCKKFKAHPDDSADKVALSAGQMKVMASPCFTPREEVVVICPTISGHSGGPCVNEEGKVIGILSRADPADRHRCYLVPTSELKKLLKLAKAQCARKPINMYR